METIQTPDGIVLHVRDEGPKHGHAVMFSNSLGTDMRVWDPLLPHLPHGLRLVRYDKRGHGLSDCPLSPYTIDELVADAGAVVDAIGLKKITFVGLSVGGLIGQGLAAARPDLMRGLVLMDTAAKIGSEEIWAERIAALRAGGLEGMADAVMERWFARSFREERPNDLGLWRNLLTRTPAEGYGGCCHAISAADMTEATAALKLPVMAIVGEEDGATPPDLVKATAALCGGAFHVIKDAGHLPCVEQPQAVAALLRDFLKEMA